MKFMWMSMVMVSVVLLGCGGGGAPDDGPTGGGGRKTVEQLAEEVKSMTLAQIDVEWKKYKDLGSAQQDKVSALEKKMAPFNGKMDSPEAKALMKEFNEAAGEILNLMSYERLYREAYYAKKKAEKSAGE